MLEAFEGLKQDDSEAAEIQRILRDDMHDTMNHWDYIIYRAAERPADIRDLRNSRKPEIAFFFVNRFL